MSKPSFSDYRQWAKTKLSVDYDRQAVKNQYKINSRAILDTLEASDFYKELPKLLEVCKNEYKNKYNVPLLMHDDIPKFEVKEYESAINKSYRSNIVENRKWPSPPKWNWTTNENWFSNLNDIVRTTFVCKFLDGPAFLAKKLEEKAKSLGLKCEIRPQERDSGYYAVHYYVSIDVNLVKENLDISDTFNAEAKCEIQITTQLQEVLRLLSRSFYQETRISLENNDSWRWEHNSLSLSFKLYGTHLAFA